MTCEKCWAEARGDEDRYKELLKTRECTPEEQAGDNAGLCGYCNRKTRHQFCFVCMNPECPSQAALLW